MQPLHQCELQKQKKEALDTIDVSVQLKCYADFTCFLLFDYNAITNGITEVKIMLRDGKTIVYDLPLWRINGKRLIKLCKKLNESVASGIK